jgi:hypothetical protein
MTHRCDEFSKSLAESVPRRESLRRLGVVLAGAVLSPVWLQTTSAGHRSKKQPDPCKAFCRCHIKKQQTACLAACSACNAETWRLCGSCGTYVCCRETGPWEYGACIDGSCRYWCAEGADYCDGSCTFLNNDPENCGTCGNVCGASTPYCSWGQCWDAGCGGADLNWDSNNCGRCGNVCPWGTFCVDGVCEGSGGGE